MLLITMMSENGELWNTYNETTYFLRTLEPKQQWGRTAYTSETSLANLGSISQSLDLSLHYKKSDLSCLTLQGNKRIFRQEITFWFISVILFPTLISYWLYKKYSRSGLLITPPHTPPPPVYSEWNKVINTNIWHQSCFHVSCPKGYRNRYQYSEDYWEVQSPLDSL